jgi:hypothetical protein
MSDNRYYVNSAAPLVRKFFRHCVTIDAALPDSPPEVKPESHSPALGRRGGKARVQNQTPEQRAESARRAAEARWAQNKKKIEGSLREINEVNQRLELVGSNQMGVREPLHLVFPQILVVESFQPLSELVGGDAV